MVRGSLQGFADLQTNGLTIKDCTLHEKDSARWVGLPGRPQLDADRNVVRDDAGKVKYVNVLEFTSPDVRAKFTQAALVAIDEYQRANPAT
jgi:hypothetical protein